MSKEKLSRVSLNGVVNKILSWGTRIFFICAIAVLAYLSFVDSFGISPSIRAITTYGLVSMVLNVMVWESYFKTCYDKELAKDSVNEKYSVHKRYYLARKGMTYKQLQQHIRTYNKDFIEAWEKDVEDITGRSIEDIRKGKYRGNTHKLLIWRVKHRKYPSTGIKTPNDVLYILSVSKSNTMKIDVKESEKFHGIHFATKFISSVLGSLLVASLTYEFIQGGWESAILKLLISIVLLVSSLFFGASNGIKSAKIKLSTAEIVSERLEEWKQYSPIEEPFTENKSTPEENSKKEQKVLEIV